MGEWVPFIVRKITQHIVGVVDGAEWEILTASVGCTSGVQVEVVIVSLPDSDHLIHVVEELSIPAFYLPLGMHDKFFTKVGLGFERGHPANYGGLDVDAVLPRAECVAGELGTVEPLLCPLCAKGRGGFFIHSHGHSVEFADHVKAAGVE